MQHPAEALVGVMLVGVLLGSMLVWTLAAQRWWRGESLVPFEPRMLVPWTGLDLVVLVFTFMGFELIGAALAAPAESTGVISAEALLGATAARVLWLGFAAVYLVVRSGAYLEDLGLDTGRLARDARTAGTLFLAAIVPVYALQLIFVYALGYPSKHPILEMTEAQPDVWVLVVATLAAVVVAPLFEEFVFRVVLQGWLEAQQVRLRRLRGWPDSTPGFAPIVISSTVFALLHVGHGPDPIALFVLSLFLGYAYRQTHRIGPPLLIHFGVNAFAMLSLWVTFLTAE